MLLNSMGLLVGSVLMNSNGASVGETVAIGDTVGWFDGKNCFTTSRSAKMFGIAGSELDEGEKEFEEVLPKDKLKTTRRMLIMFRVLSNPYRYLSLLIDKPTSHGSR